MSFKKQFKEELIDKNVWHCLNDTQIESIASMAEQQLNLYVVSQQRELFYNFITWYNAKPYKNKEKMIYTDTIEEYLKL